MTNTRNKIRIFFFTPFPLSYGFVFWFGFGLEPLLPLFFFFLNLLVTSSSTLIYIMMVSLIPFFPLFFSLVTALVELPMRARGGALHAKLQRETNLQD